MSLTPRGRRPTERQPELNAPHHGSCQNIFFQILAAIGISVRFARFENWWRRMICRRELADECARRGFVFARRTVRN